MCENSSNLCEQPEVYHSGKEIAESNWKVMLCCHTQIPLCLSLSQPKQHKSIYLLITRGLLDLNLVSHLFSTQEVEQWLLHQLSNKKDKLCHSLSRGTVSDVLGILSSTTNRNTEKDNRTVMPSETFSPDSGGSQNTRRSIRDSRTMGTMTLITLYCAFLLNIRENWKRKQVVKIRAKYHAQKYGTRTWEPLGYSYTDNCHLPCLQFWYPGIY